MGWESGRTLVPLIEKSGGNRVCGEMSGVIGDKTFIKLLEKDLDLWREV